MPLASPASCRTLRQYLNANRGRRTGKDRTPRLPRYRPCIEQLEDLTLPSTLDILNGVLTYTGTAGVTGTLTIANTGTDYQLPSDSGDAITLTATAIASGWSVNNANPGNTATGPTSTVFSQFNVSLPSANDAIAVDGSINSFTSSGTGTVSISCGSFIALDGGTIDTTNGTAPSVTLNATNGGIAENNAATITTAGTLTAQAGNNVTLNNSNTVAKVAGSSSGNFGFTDNESVTIARLGTSPTFGIDATGTATVTTTGTGSNISLPWAIDGPPSS